MFLRRDLYRKQADCGHLDIGTSHSLAPLHHKYLLERFRKKEEKIQSNNDANNNQIGRGLNICFLQRQVKVVMSCYGDCEFAGLLIGA